MAIVKGVATWLKMGSNIDTDAYDNKTHQVTLEVSKQDTDKLLESGAKLKKDEDNSFVFKRNEEWPSGELRDVPKCIDEDGMPLDHRTVGNGSEVVVQYKVIEGTYKKKPYKKFEFCAIKVTKLVPYDVVIDGEELMEEPKEKKSGQGNKEDNPF